MQRCNKSTDLLYYVENIQYMEYERACLLNNYVKTTNILEADIVCIVNPSNPSGIYKSVDEIINLINLLKNGSVIIIDESMQPWKGEDFRNDSMISKYEYIKEIFITKQIRVFIIHSWTKFFCCPGLRIGTLLCPDKKSYNNINYNQIPWNCNILALEYLNICIKDIEYMKKTWESTCILRKKQQNIINNIFHEWKVYGSKFIPWFWIDVQNEKIAEIIYNTANIENMPVRWGKFGYNQPSYIRIAVREMNYFENLINSFKNVLYCENKIFYDLNIKTKIVNVDDLKSHELINIENANKLYNYLCSLEYKTIPCIIIDFSTNIIIDGHHRLDVIKRLNIKKIEVVGINYLAENNCILVNPDNKNITKLDVINAALNEKYFPTKTTKHVLVINEKLVPIISISHIISL